MTVFEKIATHEIPANIVLENDELVAFHDVNPQAPVHVLVVPRRPIARFDAAAEDDAGLLGRLLLAGREVAQKLGIAQTGYRLVLNNGSDAGESVPHLHLHVLGGRRLLWPPG